MEKERKKKRMESQEKKGAREGKRGENQEKEDKNIIFDPKYNSIIRFPTYSAKPQIYGKY